METHKVSKFSIFLNFCSSYPFGHYQFIIETKFKYNNEPEQVKRRYTEFVELYTLLSLERPTCILPSLPPKDVQATLQGKESEVMRTRKNELEKFLEMLVQHQQFSQSKILEDFLKDQSSEPFTVDKHRKEVEP